MKHIKTFIIITLIFVSLLIVLGRLVEPKYASGVVEGAFIREYYNDEKNNQVIFLGDCEVYDNISPVDLFLGYGITSFIRGSANQTVWQSYYLLEETLKYEKPEVVVYNVQAMKYSEPVKEAYNHMTIDNMKLSLSKIRSYEASKFSGEKLFDYITPLFYYHSRIFDLSKDDIKYFFNNKKITHNGYYMRVDVKEMDILPAQKKLANYEFGERSYEYLDKMVDLCEKNDIELLLIKAPILYPYWHEEWDEQIVSYANDKDITYINFIEEIDDMGIDFSSDTYDGGLHLNLNGAKKFTKRLGEELASKYELSDMRRDKSTAKAWDSKIAFYHEMKNLQEMEINLFGKLVSCGGIRK